MSLVKLPVFLVPLGKNQSLWKSSEELVSHFPLVCSWMKRTRLRLAAAALVLARAVSFVNTSPQVRSSSIQAVQSSFRSSNAFRDSSSAFAQAISSRGSASPYHRSSYSRGCCRSSLEMCRLMVFKGDAVPLSDLLYHPTNSLINQSHTQRRSSLIPGLPESLHMALNIDGCGLAYYDSNQQPNVYRCASAAWADAGLRELSMQAHSNLIFGHVRSASAGVTGEQAAAVGESNCHPFSYRGLSFMHNGTCVCYCVCCTCTPNHVLSLSAHTHMHTAH
jgi:hypothetical protein